MNKIFAAFPLALVALLALMALAAPAMAAAPSATTEAATNIKPQSVTLNGTIETGGKSTLAGFELGTVEYSGEGPGGKLYSGVGVPIHVSTVVTGLTPNTTYVFRIGALNSDGQAFGKYLTFKTPKLLGLYYDEPAGLFKALAYPATISGAGTEAFQFTASGLELSCGSSQFSGSMAEDTNSLRLGAVLSECASNLGATSVSMNSCAFRLTTTSFSGSLVLGIECQEVGDAIVLSNPYCTIRLAPQSPSAFGSVQVKGEAKEGSSIQVGGSNTNVSFTKQGSYCFAVGGKIGTVKFGTKLAHTG